MGVALPSQTSRLKLIDVLLKRVWAARYTKRGTDQPPPTQFTFTYIY